MSVKTLTALALLKNGVAPLANIARRPVKLAAEKRRKVVTVAESAAIGDIGHAIIAMAQQVARFINRTRFEIALRRQPGLLF
jgi:hypothetical protein